MRLAVVKVFNRRRGFGFAEVLDQFDKPTGMIAYFHVVDVRWLKATSNDTVCFEASKVPSRWLKSEVRVGNRIVLELAQSARGFRAMEWAPEIVLETLLTDILRDSYTPMVYMVYKLDPQTGSLKFVWKDDDCYTLSARFPKRDGAKLVFVVQSVETVEYEGPEGCGSYDQWSDWGVCAEPRVDLSMVPLIIQELYGPRRTW